MAWLLLRSCHEHNSYVSRTTVDKEIAAMGQNWYESGRADEQERYGTRLRPSRPEWSERQRSLGSRHDHYDSGYDDDEWSGERERDEQRSRYASAGRRGERSQRESGGIDSDGDGRRGPGFGSSSGDDRYDYGYPNYVSSAPAYRGGRGTRDEEYANRGYGWSERGRYPYRDQRSGYGASYGSGQDAGAFRGRSPKGYARSDERLSEIICERLTDHPDIDPSDVSISVKSQEVTLSGSVADRRMKHAIENIVDECGGIREIHNQLRVKRPGDEDESRSGASSSERARGSSRSATT
jgi:hypothetical protein